MRTQTFEQAFKEIFREDLQALISNVSNRKLYMSNDISVKPLEYDPEGIVGIIQSGDGRKQEIKGYDLTTYPCIISFILEMNYLQDFLSILQHYISQNNSIIKTLEFYKNESETAEYDYIMNFNTPSMLSDPTDLSLKDRNVKVAKVILTAEIRYTLTSDISIPSFKLKLTKEDDTVVETEVKGEGLISKDNAVVPEYETFYVYGNKHALQVPIIMTEVITIQLAQIKDNSLHDLLQDVSEGMTYLKKVEYKSTNPLDSYREYRYQITQGYDQGVKVFSLVLSR